MLTCQGLVRKVSCSWEEQCSAAMAYWHISDLWWCFYDILNVMNNCMNTYN